MPHPAATATRRIPTLLLAALLFCPPVLAQDGGQNVFYRNLFYILIGLLGAFGVLSFLSLLRARHRRVHIRREAERMGMLVPGMDGYIPLRERQTMRWTHADGRVSPDWWEVGAERWLAKWLGRAAAATPPVPVPVLPGYTDDTGAPAPFHPLALIPPYAAAPRPPAPRSKLRYFPHGLAYRPEDLLPAPSKYSAESIESMEALAGEKMDVVTLVRMPVPPRGEAPIEEGEEILVEWGGVCVGVMSVGVGEVPDPARWSEEGRGKGRAG